MTNSRLKNDRDNHDSDKAPRTIPEFERWILDRFVPDRFRDDFFIDIRVRYIEILELKGASQARKYLHWEMRRLAVDHAKYHLKIMLLIEGIIKLMKYLTQF